jgi:ATP-dependent Lon protease
VVIPYQNEKDLNDLPPYVRKKINFVPVRHMDEVIKIALARK